MCRFIAYRGKPILLDQVLHKPKNSLINQSAQAHEAEEPLNGDGFGVGWYMKDLDPEPGLFVSVRPAWNDRNLRYLCQKVSTTCFFAHVRAASAGEVSEANCHPFHFKNFLFMHNGGIGGFQRLKRHIRRKLSDEVYDWIRGQTDSEHLFALILENLANRDGRPTAHDMAEATEKTIRELQEMKRELGIDETCYINSVITDGDVMVAVRYVSDLKEPASTLYYSEGHHYEVKDGVCTLRRGAADEHAVLVVSEKLTMSRTEWVEIPTNSMLIVDKEQKTFLKPIENGAGKREARRAPDAEAGGGGGSKSRRGGFRAKRSA